MGFFSSITIKGIKTEGYEMAGTVFDENYIMSTLKELCENIDLCGFEAYIVKKESPKLRRMSLDEQINENGDNFRTVLKNLFIDIIKERYLSEDVRYTDGHKLADNQNKYFYFEQGESFHPFKYLNDKKEIAEFEEDDLSSASGLAFEIRKGNKSLWIYQHLWGIMVPNKKKTNLMTRVMRFENKIVFSEQKESLLTIAHKIDIIIFDGYLITGNTTLLQKYFGFHDYIYQAAHQTVQSIASKDLVENIDKLSEYISRGKSRYAKKMMRIGTSRVFNLTKEQLIEKINTLPRWHDKFSVNKNTNQIILNTYGEVESLIDLFDERYTRSDVTDTEYDTDVKTVAQPMKE